MDLILYNGIGYTMDENNPLVHAMAIVGNKIAAVGSNIEILKLKSKNTILINLHNNCFIPGLNDSHLHLYGTGKFLSQVNLLEIASISAVKQKVSDFLHNTDDEWILGRGWNQDYFIDEARYINRSDLDEISTERPIVLTRACGHVITVNSKAIKLAGVDENTRVFEGTIDLEKGIFTENAINLITHAIPNPSITKVKEILLKAMKYANSFGITSLQTDDFTQGEALDKQTVLQAYLELQKEQLLTCRIYEQSLLPKINNLQEFIEAGYKTGIGDDFFKIGPLKLIADGSLGARTAALKKPYADDKNTMGILIYEKDELKDIISYAHNQGMQIAVHCIGDDAMEQVLDIYEEVLKANPRDNHRHGIVHCQIMNENLHQRFAFNNIIAYIQPIFIHYDHLIVEKRVGYELAKTSYAFQSLLKNGVKIAMGTDSPIELINPFNNIYCAVTRKSLNNTPQNGWLLEESLSIQEALFSYTVGSAYASFEETLKRGYLADVAIIDKDIFNIPHDEIPSINVLMTIVDGRVVYERDFDE